MWICRAGRDAVYLEYYIEKSRIYLAWDGFKINFSAVSDKKEYRTIVAEEKDTQNPTSISNWAGQITAFVFDMKIGDYVLIPHRSSAYFELAQISGDYEYNAENEEKLYHSRKVRILNADIPKRIFPQTIQYGLRAYRTVYKVRNEDQILRIIESWREKEIQR